MKIRKLYIVLVASAALFIGGCADEATCIPEYTDLLQVSFVSDAGKAKNITIVSLEVEGSNENFPIIQDSTLNKLAIPLNPLDSVIKLNFVQASVTNKLVISYKTTQRLTDPKCGLETAFEKVAIDTTDFIDAVVIGSTLNKDIATNVKITH